LVVVTGGLCGLAAWLGVDEWRHRSCDLLADGSARPLQCLGSGGRVRHGEHRDMCPVCQQAVRVIRVHGCNAFRAFHDREAGHAGGEEKLGCGALGR
jgi:hypothetical protein